MNIPARVDLNRNDSLPTGTDTLAPVLESLTVILTVQLRRKVFIHIVRDWILVKLVVSHRHDVIRELE